MSINHPDQHVFHVSMVVWASPKDDDILVALPAWNALYQVRDFSYRVREVCAITTDGARSPLSVRKIDKQTWRISLPPVDPRSPARGADISYSIEWDDPGPFDAQLNSHHAFINFAEILMYVPDRRNEDSNVVFHGVPEGWNVIAELPHALVAESSFAFAAPSYDALVDAPVEAGKFDEFEFDNVGAHFRVVVDAKEWNKSRLEDALRRITGYELQLMGGPPFKEYTFFFHIGPYPEVGGGGMEHANSTAIAASSLEGVTYIAAHEFFHLWNVKRIRPQSLEPVDYTKEQYTRALWFAEGVTSTYGSYTLERSGLWTKDQFYDDLASEITQLQPRPARTWQSVEESSLDAWLEKYDAYSLPDRSISYYNKGQILGVLLDVAIRDATDNRKSLDDVLRRMNNEYAKAGKFYNDSEGIRAVVEEVSGKKFGDFFQRYVAGTDDIPYDDFLAAAGLGLKIAIIKTADLGFWPGRPRAAGIAASAVEPGGPAEAAGLRVGDVLLKMNDEDLPRNLFGWLRAHSPGEMVKLRVRRGGQELEVSYALSSREDRRYSIAEVSQPSDKQRRIREGLLRGTTD